ALDADSGSNNLQNFPVLTAATSDGTQTTVLGTLNSSAGGSFLIEFFANSTADPSGNGEGEAPLGSLTVNTNASGDADFTFVGGNLPAGSVVTATATNLATNDPSEFSTAVIVSATGGGGGGGG